MTTKTDDSLVYADRELEIAKARADVMRRAEVQGGQTVHLA